MQNNFLHIGVVALIIVLIVSLLDPFMLVMPESMVMLALVAATVLVCVWAGLVLREMPGDEREALHRLHAGRIAYVCGIAVLTVGIVFEALAVHHVDPWLILSLGVMIVAKLAARLYADTYQ